MIGKSGNQFSIHRQQDLDHSCGTGSGECVPDTCLDRSQRTLSWAPGIILPQLEQTSQFSGVTHRSAGGVALDVIDCRRGPAGRVVGGTHRPQLSLARRSEQATGAIVGETRSADHSEDGTAFGDRIIESLQQQDSGTFSDQQALPTMVEGATAALGREGSKLRETHLGEEAIWSRDPSSESRIAASCGEIATCDR